MLNWEAIRAEAVKILGDLIRINTTNPPGNELAAGQYIQSLLAAEGITASLHETFPGRGNLVARVPGSGAGRPLILLAHLDVVAANPSQWRFDPFAGMLADGYIWGRGALDMKSMLTMELLTLMLLKRSGQVLQRDVVLIAAADEEAGGVYGMERLMAEGLPELAEVEFVINEGGEGTYYDGVPVYACQNGEKGTLWVKLTVAGIAGHASMPAADNAILHMAKVLERLARHKRPIELCDTTRRFLTGLAQAKGMAISRSSNRDYSLKLFAGRHFKKERSIQAMLNNTISPTVIRAGEKTNVLPECCEATLDCRLLPGETPEHFLKELRSLINDSRVELQVIQAAAPTESDPDTLLFSAMREVLHKESPTAILVPYLSPGGTDSRYFRELGITAYGFMPILIDENELQRMHGVDERLSVDNLEQGTRILFEVVKKVAIGQ